MERGYRIKMDKYEEILSKMELYKELEVSESQFSEGKTKEAREALDDLRIKHGLQE